MKKIFKNGDVIAIIIIVFLCLHLSSCGDKTYTKEQTKIDQYIANRDFDKAREVALSIPKSAVYYDMTKGNLYYQQEELYKINAAQISLIINNGEMEDAEALARELDAMPVFMELVMKNMTKLYDNNFRSLCSFLARYTFTTLYHEKLVDYNLDHIQLAEEYAAKLSRKNVNNGSYGKDYYYSSNVGYNHEVNVYNNYVMQALDMALFDKDIDRISKLYVLLKPEAIETKREITRKSESGIITYGIVTYKLENRAADAARKKAKQLGINL